MENNNFLYPGRNSCVPACCFCQRIMESCVTLNFERYLSIGIMGSALESLAMKRNNNEIEQELDAALGKPKYYIDTAGMKEDERYSWFPTLGNSMTDDTAKSIPGGSLVLGRWLKLNSVRDVPLHQPIVFILNDDGEQFCILKSACEILSSTAPRADTDLEMLCLRSYNPAPRYDDFWLPFSCIKFIFVVEKVRRPDGREFVPKQEEVTRKAEEKA